MKKNIKVENLIFFITLLAIFLYMLYINIHTHKYHDEFVYTFIYGTNIKCKNLVDVFISLKNLYLMHNGRIISTGIMCILLMLPKIISDVLNSVFFILLIILIFKFSTFYEDTNIKIINLFLIIFMLWVTIPEFNGTITWFSGSVNYLWSTVFMLLYLNIFIKYFVKNIKFSKIKCIILTIFGFIVGSLHESIGIINTSFLFFILIFELLKDKKINYCFLFSCLSSFLGFLSIILSPGSHIRSIATTSGNNIILHDTFFNCLKMIKLTFTNNIFIFAFILFFIIYFIIKNKFSNCFKNKFFIINIFFIFSAILVYISMIFSPTFAERVTFAPYILFVLSFFGLFSLVPIPNKFKNFIKILLIIYFLLLSIPSFIETTNLVKLYYDEWNNRDNYIKTEKALGKTNIQVSPFSTPLNEKMYGGDISISTSYNHNGSMAMYYDLDTIRIKKDFYIDFTFCDLNQENNFDSITLSNDSEISTELISILPKQILEKQAPYKKNKHSCIGGNITLYYGINNLKNLKLFIKSDSNKLSLQSIHIYNYNNIDYTITGYEIKNKISYFHNLKLNCENNSLILTHFGDNPYLKFNLE